MQRADVIIIGAGASGLFCARTAAAKGRTVVALEHGSAVGRKLTASGGGRCNFTNLSADADAYLCGNPHFVKSALSRFTPHQALEWLSGLGFSCERKAEGQYFCSQGAARLTKALEAECLGLGVEIVLHCFIRKVESGFTVRTSRGEFQAPALVVAAGGKSWPQLGASGLGYKIAEQFGLGVTRLRPGLVPLVMPKPWAWSDLSGVSFKAGVACKRAAFEDDILITHKGLSGPAILQVSSYLEPGEALRFDALPGKPFSAVTAVKGAGAKTVQTLLRAELPKRAADAVCPSDLAGRRSADLTKQERERLGESLHQRALTPAGNEGWSKAEVTVGGVDVQRISSKTMEAMDVPGLFFIGEALDVAGRLGGYNLQWAWSSGRAAGEAL